MSDKTLAAIIVAAILFNAGVSLVKIRIIADMVENGASLADILDNLTP